MNGSNGSTTFTDSALGGQGHTWTAYGSAQITTSYYPPSNSGGTFGGSSGSFLSSGSSYINTPYSSDFDMGTGDFTWECWAMWPTIPTSETYEIMMGQVDSTEANQMIFYTVFDVSGKNWLAWTCYKSSAYVAYYYATGWTVAANTWYHLALVRSGPSVFMFSNGVSQALTASTAITSSSNCTLATNNPMTIGRMGSYSTAYYMNGYISEVRITKGVARWIGNFSVATKQYGITQSPYPVFFPEITS